MVVGHCVCVCVCVCVCECVSVCDILEFAESLQHTSKSVEFLMNTYTLWSTLNSATSLVYNLQWKLVSNFLVK